MIDSSVDSGDSDEDSVICHYNDDLQLPIYSTVDCGYPATDFVNILMSKSVDS